MPVFRIRIREAFLLFAALTNVLIFLPETTAYDMTAMSPACVKLASLHESTFLQQ